MTTAMFKSCSTKPPNFQHTLLFSYILFSFSLFTKPLNPPEDCWCQISTLLVSLGIYWGGNTVTIQVFIPFLPLHQLHLGSAIIVKFCEAPVICRKEVMSSCPKNTTVYITCCIFLLGYHFESMKTMGLDHTIGEF